MTPSPEAPVVAVWYPELRLKEIADSPLVACLLNPRVGLLLGLPADHPSGLQPAIGEKKEVGWK